MPTPQARRRLLTGAAALTAAIGILVVAHLPPVRSSVRSTLLDWLQTNLGIVAAADDLSYNLLTLDVRLRGISAAAAGSDDRPFFTADELRVNLPWRAVFGSPALESISLTRASLVIVRGEDGTLNLPSGAGAGESAHGPGSIDIGQIVLRQVDVRYHDAASGLDAWMEGIDLEMLPRGRGVAGRLSVAAGPSLRTGEFELPGSLSGSLAYDGTSLELAGLRVSSALGQAQIDGSLGDLWTTPAVALTLAGNLSLADLSPALGLADPLTGSVTISASAEGALDDPRAAFNVGGETLDWRHLRVSALDVHGSADATNVRFTASAEVADGALEVESRLGLSPLELSTTAGWRDLSARMLAGPDLPADISALLNGHATLDWAVADGLPGLTATFDLDARADSRPGPDTIDVDGRLSLTARDSAWRMTLDQRLSRAVDVAGQFEGTLGETLAGTTVSGRAIVAAADLSRTMAPLRAAGVDVPEWAAATTGSARADVAILGSLAEPVASGTIGLTELRAPGLPATDIDSRFAARRERIEAAGVRAAVGPNVLEGEASFEFTTRSLEGRFDLVAPDVGAFGELAETWRAAGRLTGQIALGGTAATPSLDVTASAAEFTVAGQPIAELELDASYRDNVASIARLTLLQTTGGRAHVAGAYHVPDGRHDLWLTAASFAIAPVEAAGAVLPVTGTIDGALESRGTFEQPAGEGAFTLTGAGWSDVRLDRADLSVSMSERGVQTSIDAPALSFTAEALVEPRAPYPASITAAAVGTRISSLVRLLGQSLPPALARSDGVIDARLKAAGPLGDPENLVVEAAITHFDVTADEASLRLLGTASARYENSTLIVEDARFGAGATVIDLGGRMPLASPASSGGLRLAIDGRLEDLDPWLRMAGVPELSAAGQLTADFEAAGSLQQAAVTGRLLVKDGRLEWDGYPAATGVVVDIAVDGDAIDVAKLDARWEEALLSGVARVPLTVLEGWLPAALLPPGAGAGPATLRARLDNLTPAALAPFAGGAVSDTLTGRVDAQIDLSADRPEIGSLSGELVLTELTLTAEGLPIRQERPTRVEIRGGEVQIGEWTWTVAGSPIQVAGRAALSGDQAVEADVRGRLDLRVARAFLPGISTDGEGDLTVSVRGTLAAPLAEGAIQVRNGELLMADPRIGVSNASGLILLAPNRIDLTGLEGDLNGGRFAAIGGVTYRGLSLTGGALSIESQGVALNIPEGFQTEVDAALTVAFDNRIQVSGRVNLVRGAYREPLSLAVGLAAATRSRGPSPAGGGATLLDQVDLNVAVASAEDLIVDNNYGRMEIGIDVRLVGTAAQPAIVGRSSIREGGILFLGGRSYLVERGVIDFTDPRAIVPDLDLSARTRLRGPDESGAGIEYDISLELTGTPETIEATLSSDPARSQADIVSLLATGRLADQAGGVGGAAATQQAIGLLSGEALGFAAQAIGVDSIRLERDPALDPFAADPAIAAEVDPAQRLTVSRRVANVELTLSQNLRDTGLFTWIVAYSPIRPVELRTVSRDDRSRSYELRHDVSIGGAPQAPRASAARPIRVAGVRLSGDLGFPEDAVTGALDLGPGDRFDFYRWQRDRDRLRAFYIARRHFDVRISARRLEAAGNSGPSVFLEYHIEAGSRARLEFEGFELSRRAVSALERIWSDTIIDVALEADLRDAALRELAREGYLRADVHVERVPSGSDEKLLRISIDPGTRSASMRIETAGNVQVSDAQVVAAADALGIEAWVTPRSLADEVARLYRQAGWLAAEVTAGPLEFSDRQATLPVRVVEGPRFTVSRVTIEGVAVRPLPEVLEDFGLAAGMPYTPAGVQQARLDLARAYDREGFNTMTSVIEEVADFESGTVELRVSVIEGPRQVLQAITVSGAADVRPHVVADALNLSTGDPADLEEWYAGRRRLFRTGLFQRVDIEPVPLEGTGAPAGVQPVRAEVSLVRRAPWRIRYGVDVTDEAAPLADQGRVFGGGVGANIERYGLAGRPATAGAGLRYNNRQRAARGFVTVPSFLGWPVASRLFVSRSRDLIEGAGILSVIVDRTAFTAEQRFRPAAAVEVAYGYQIERNHTFDPDPNPDDPFAIDNRVQAARLTGTVVVDTRDDAFEPSRGMLHSSTVEYAPERLGSDIRFAKYSVQQFVFAEVARSVVSASAVRLGVGRGFGQRLIFSEQFFAGGANTVRGYAEGAIAGYDFFGDPIGGQAVIVLNQELRFPVWRWLAGAAFVDAGQVFDRAADMSFGALETGVGAGFRFRTPVGLFRLDVATPVPAAERSFDWYFAFGHTF